MSVGRSPIFFIGCVESSQITLQTLLNRNEIEVIGVLCRRKSRLNADFVDIAKIALEAGVAVYFSEDFTNKGRVQLLNEVQPEIVFAVGWSDLLDEDIIDIPQAGIIGFHPEALPQNRGRHPLIWALAIGLEETASTLFLMDRNADSGPIINQRIIKITSQDDARSLYNKVLEVLPIQINCVVDQLVSGGFSGTPQDTALAYS